MSIDTAIGVIGAMPEEIALMLSRLQEVTERTILQRQFYCGSLQGRRVVLVQSGIGKSRSAITATILASHFSVRGVNLYRGCRIAAFAVEGGGCGASLRGAGARLRHGDTNWF